MNLAKIFKLRRLEKESREVWKKFKEFKQSEEFKKLTKEERHNETGFRLIDIELTDDEIRVIETRELIRKASKLGIPIPPIHANNPGDSDWRESNTGDHFLTEKGFHELRREIRDEQKARADLRLAYVPLITALAGLGGVSIGILSIFFR